MTNKKNLQDIAHKEKEKGKRAMTIQKYAIRMAALAAVGVITVIVLATNAGKDRRKDIKNKVEENVTAIRDTVRKRAEMMEAVKKDIKDG